MNKFTQLREIISSTLGIDPEIVTLTLSAGDIPQWDSMGNMAIIARIEEEVGVEIPMEDLFDLNSVETLLAEIDKLTRQ